MIPCEFQKHPKPLQTPIRDLLGVGPSPQALPSVELEVPVEPPNPNDSNPFKIKHLSDSFCHFLSITGFVVIPSM